MAKFASREEQRFSPISQKLIEAVSGPARQKPIALDVQEEAAKVVQLRTKVDEETSRESFEETNHDKSTPATGEQDTDERLTVTMRYHVSPEEKEDTEEFIRRLSSAAKIRLTHSNIMRACRDILFQVEERLVTELSKAKLRRPINEKRAIAFFESRLTEIIRTAIRQSPLPHGRGGRE
ncbi:MAG: hypothetical protein AB1671_03955 [Thermodesulfobacteriota bacterium]|jgi:hypothetical protein